MGRDLSGFDAAERRFTLLFFPVALSFGARMALVVFDGPLARLFTDNGYLIGLLLAMGPLIATVANPFFGRLSDRTWTRFGRRIPYALAGVFLSTLVLFAIPSSPTFAVLLGLFALRGFLLSIGGVPLMSLVPDLVGAARRGRAMSLFLLGGGVGAIIIQLAGKMFWEKNFALVFYTAGLISLVFAVPPLLFIREPRPHAAELEAARKRAAISVAAIIRAVARGGPIVLFLASASLRYLGGGMIIAYLTLFASTDLGITVGDASLAVAVAGIMRLLFALPAGRLVDRYERKRLLLAATVSIAIAQLGMGVFVHNLWQLYVAVVVSTIASVLEMVAGGPLFMDLLPADRRGELIGVNMVLTHVFQGAGALLGGAVFAWTGGYRAVYPVAALCFALSAVVLTQLTVSVPAAAASRPLLPQESVP